MDLVLSIREGGLIFAGPPCGLIIFVSSSVHKRSASRPYGDEGNIGVFASDILASNICITPAASFFRGVRFVIEQPMTSKLWHLPRVAGLLDMTSARSVFTYQGAFGTAVNKLHKATHLKGTISNLEKLKRKMPTKELSKAARAEFWHTDSGGRMQGRRLKQTAAYARPFCKAVMDAFTESSAEPAPIVASKVGLQLKRFMQTEF